MLNRPDPASAPVLASALTRVRGAAYEVIAARTLVQNLEVVQAKKVQPIPATLAGISALLFSVVTFFGRTLISNVSGIDSIGLLSFVAVVAAVLYGIFMYSVLAKPDLKPKSKLAVVAVATSPLAALPFAVPAYLGTRQILGWPAPVALTVMTLVFTGRTVTCWHSGVRLPGGLTRIKNDMRRAWRDRNAWIFLKLAGILLPTLIFSLISGDAIYETIQVAPSLFFDSATKFPVPLIGTLTGIGIVPTFALTFNIMDLCVSFMAGEIPHLNSLRFIVALAIVIAITGSPGVIATANGKPSGKVTQLLIESWASPKVNKILGGLAALLYATAMATPSTARLLEGLAKLIFGREVFGPNSFNLPVLPNQQQRRVLNQEAYVINVQAYKPAIIEGNVELLPEAA